MNGTLVRACLLFTLMTTCFTFGRLTVEFRGTGVDWGMVIMFIVILICSLIGLISFEAMRAK